MKASKSITKKRGARPKAEGRLGGDYIARIEGLRKALHLTKPKFGEKLGVQQSVVSAWTMDKKAPSGRTLAGLVNLAATASRPEDVVFFLKKAGIDDGAIAYIAGRYAEQTVKAPKLGDTLNIPVFTSGSFLRRLHIDVSLVEKGHHLQTVVRELETSIPDSPFGTGDLLVIDKALGSSNLQALDGKLVLAEFASSDGNSDAWRRPDWPSGLIIGTILIDTAGSATAVRGLGAGTARLEDVTTTWIASLASGAGTGFVIGVAESSGPKPQDFRPFDGCQILGSIVGWFKRPPEKSAGHR